MDIRSQREKRKGYYFRGINAKEITQQKINADKRTLVVELNDYKRLKFLFKSKTFEILKIVLLSATKCIGDNNLRK